MRSDIRALCVNHPKESIQGYKALHIYTKLSVFYQSLITTLIKGAREKWYCAHYTNHCNNKSSEMKVRQRDR